MNENMYENLNATADTAAWGAREAPHAPAGTRAVRTESGNRRQL